MTQLKTRIGRRPKWWLASALGLALACAPSAPGPDVVATTDLGQITLAELEAYILSLPEDRRAPAGGQDLKSWRQSLLEELIVARAAEAEAIDQELVESEEGQAILAAQVNPVLREEVRSRMLAERVDVSEEVLRAFYDANPQDFGHSEQIRVRNIYRRVDKAAPAEVWEQTRQEMESYLDQLGRGARFEDLAKAHSDSETANLEGLIGRLSRGTLDPKLEEILWSLDEGETTDVLRTSNGFQLFKLENSLGTFKMPFEEARTRLTRRLTREQTEAAEAAYLEELVAESGATFRPEALNAEPDEVVFGLGEETVTVEQFHDRLRTLAFWDSRGESQRARLEAFASERLYLWQAERQGVAEEPEIAEQLRLIEQQTRIALALEARRIDRLEALDEEALKAYYEANRERFRSSKLTRIRILTRDFPEDETQWYRVYEELEELAGEIRAGRGDFADAARKLSSDFSAARGGDVGAIRPDAMAEWAGPQAQRVLLDLAPGEVSDPVLIERFNTNRPTYDRSGYMLILLEEVEESRHREFDEVRDQVLQRFIERGDADVNQQVREGMLESVSATIFPENL